MENLLYSIECDIMVFGLRRVVPTVGKEVQLPGRRVRPALARRTERIAAAAAALRTAHPGRMLAHCAPSTLWYTLDQPPLL